MTPPPHEAQAVCIETGGVRLDGQLLLPENGGGVVVFVHGSGSSRHSPRNQFVASSLEKRGLGSLLFDLLTDDEETRDRQTGELRFDISFLSKRVLGATRWLRHYFKEHDHSPPAIGYFGASTGAAAALVASTQQTDEVQTVVSRGGRPDLAGEALRAVKVPVLLIVGGQDTAVIGMNRDAQAELEPETRLEIVEGATHLFEEPGALEKVAELAGDWFEAKLMQRAS